MKSTSTVCLAFVLVFVAIAFAQVAQAGCPETQVQSHTCSQQCGGGSNLVVVCQGITSPTNCCFGCDFIECPNDASCQTWSSCSTGSCGKSCILGMNPELKALPAAERARVYAPSCGGGYVPVATFLENGQEGVTQP